MDQRSLQSEHVHDTASPNSGPGGPGRWVLWMHGSWVYEWMGWTGWIVKVVLVGSDNLCIPLYRTDTYAVQHGMYILQHISMYLPPT